MEWTNKYNLSDRVIRVLVGKYKQRQPELNRLSITDLIDDPLPRILYTKFWDKIVRDYSDLFTMVMGTSLHSRYEENFSDEDDVERKYEDVVSVLKEHAAVGQPEGIITVGKADLFNRPTGIIVEVKQTGCYGPKYRLPKWIKQMNCYAWQRGKRGIRVTGLLVDVWYRDWKQKNITWRDYPQIPYEELKLPLWDCAKSDKYVCGQVAKHLAHPVYDMLEEYDKPCSEKQRGIRWEAYKKTNKTPTKVGDTYDEVNSWVQKQRDIFTIRQSEPIFCNLYCRARSVCPFAKGE